MLQPSSPSTKASMDHHWATHCNIIKKLASLGFEPVATRHRCSKVWRPFGYPAANTTSFYFLWKTIEYSCQGQSTNRDSRTSLLQSKSDGSLTPWSEDCWGLGFENLNWIKRRQIRYKDTAKNNFKEILKFRNFNEIWS